MPYTIICHHHRGGHNGRHPQQWETWDEAARELGDVVEGMITRLSSALNEAERCYVEMLAAKAASFGVAVLPGLATYRVVDVADAPASQPNRGF